MDDIKEIPKSYHILFIIYYTINFAIILGLSIFIHSISKTPYLLRGKNVNKYSNDYCQNENNLHYDLLCNNTYFNYKKSKFIWITIDGTATDQLIELHNLEKYKITTSFLNLGKYNKYTSMLYEAMMTGKLNKNMIGKEIEYDNFIKQLIEANYKISFIGWKEPIISLAGDDLSNKFYKTSIDDDHEILAFNSFCNMTNMFPFLYEDFVDYQKTEPNNKIDSVLEKKIIDLIDKIRDDDYYLLKNISKNNFFEELDEIFSEVPNILFDLNITNCLIKNFKWNNEDNISIIYYSSELDTFNHNYGKNHIYSLLNSYIVEKMVINIMKWIDEHPDYALIFNSDHGGQHFYGEDTIRNHGEDFPGNEGVFYIYTNEFKNNYKNLKMSERYISIIDESALMPEILINVNIPLESKGIPFPLINDEIFAYSSLKRKEIQLIKLIKEHDKDGENEDFQIILNQLYTSFGQIDEIKNKYFNKDDTNSRKEFKRINKNNLDKLINQQNEINKIIRKNSHSKTNVAITAIIIIMIVIKSFFECLYILKLLTEKYCNLYSTKQKILLIIFFVLYLYIIEYIFLFFQDTSKKLQFLVQLYIFITCIILIVIKNVISYQNKENLKIEKKIYYYFLITSGFLFFEIFSEYSYSYNSIKSFFTRRKPQLLLNIFVLYPLLIIFTINEIKKYNFTNKNKKGEYAFKCNIIINIIFIITIFIEDMSYKTYYHQNNVNLVSMYITFIVFIIYLLFCFIINALNLINENNKENNNSKNLDTSPNEITNIGVLKFEENNNNNLNCKTEFSNEAINKRSEKIESLNLYLENNQKKEIDYFYYYNNNIIYLKMCIIQGTFWLSDESEKIYVFLSLIFFELSEYMNKFLHLNFFNIIHERNDSNLSSGINTNNSSNKGFKKKNVSLFSFIFYIIIQKITINMNQLLFLLIVHSYDMNTSKQQKQKFMRISSFLEKWITTITNYKFSFITAVYIIEKNFYKINNNKIEIRFSLFFILKRIIINLRLNNSINLFIFQSLIIIKEEESFGLFSYYLIDFMLFLFDYLCVVVQFVCLLFVKIVMYIYRHRK